MKMYVWSCRPAFLAVAQADSVDAARKRIIEEIGASGDGSCPERDKAREYVKANQPSIWIGTNAEFALTDSAELVEMDAFLQTKDQRIRELEAERDRLTRELAEYVTHAEGTYAEVWAERNGWQARAEIAERGLAEAQVFREAVLNCGLPEKWEAEDPRIDYVTVQVDKADWAKCQAALDAARQKEQGNG